MSPGLPSRPAGPWREREREREKEREREREREREMITLVSKN